MATLKLGTISSQSWYELTAYHTEKLMLKQSFHQAHIHNAEIILSHLQGKSTAIWHQPCTKSFVQAVNERAGIAFSIHHAKINGVTAHWGGISVTILGSCSGERKKSRKFKMLVLFVVFIKCWELKSSCSNISQFTYLRILFIYIGPESMARNPLLCIQSPQKCLQIIIFFSIVVLFYAHSTSEW